ncbi:MAG: hypothetical protein VKJ06_01105 [Vampirovibrionales bacterium]|nr:hypothetical protein [Vampirovibrionales bacterium]
MKFANMREASQNFSSITRLIEAGDEVVLTKNGKPYLLIQRLEEDDLEDYILAKHHGVEEAARNPIPGGTLEEVKKQFGV